MLILELRGLIFDVPGPILELKMMLLGHPEAHVGLFLDLRKQMLRTFGHFPLLGARRRRHRRFLEAVVVL